MKLLIVDPPGKNKGLNTGLAYLSATMEGRHDIYILDLNNIEVGSCGEVNKEIPMPEMESIILAAIDSFQPDLFGVSVKTFTAVVSSHFIKLVKQNRPNIKTIVGGPHITLDGESYIREHDIDYGIFGEGEYSLVELCDALSNNGSLDTVDGLFFLKNGEVEFNPKSQNIPDLDNIPYPVYDTFSSVKSNGGQLKQYPILTSRGCPYHCTYCSMPKIMGNKWRSHSAERVIEELKWAKQKYQSTSFTVVDDNFTLNLKRVETICDQLIADQLSLPWNSQNGIRADRINAVLAQKMSRSGCHHVWIGIESADEEVFDAINKGEKLGDIRKGIQHLKEAGIRVGGFFIIGLPYSTRETDLKSIDFVKTQAIDGWWFNFVPFPHTEAEQWVRINASLLRHSDGALLFGANSIEPVFETDDYSKASRIETYNEIHIRLKLFDRLADPALKDCEKWRHIWPIVKPYGGGTVFSFLSFIVKYHAKSLIKIVKG